MGRDAKFRREGVETFRGRIRIGDDSSGRVGIVDTVLPTLRNF